MDLSLITCGFVILENVAYLVAEELAHFVVANFWVDLRDAEIYPSNLSQQ